MFGCHLKLTAYVMLYKFFKEFIVFIGKHIVKAYTRTNEHLFYLWQFSKFSKKRKVIGMVGFYGGAYVWRKAFFIGAQAVF